MRVDNLGANGMKDIITRLEKLERATPMNNASIGRNGLRVHSGGVITIQNGGLKITGTAEIIGQLIGSGAITWTGPVSFTGQTDLDGPTTVDGALTINGATSITGTTTVTGAMNILGDVDITKTLDVTGATKLVGNTRIMGTTTLEDDMTVTSGGKITVGNMKIGDGTHGSGKGISFTNGGALAANGGMVEMYAATYGLIKAGDGAGSESGVYHGGSGVSVNSGNGIKLAGLALNTGLTPNVHIDGQGRLWRTS